MLIPYAVDIPQDRWPVANWLLIMVTVAVFVMQHNDMAEARGRLMHQPQRPTQQTQDQSDANSVPTYPGITGMLILDRWSPTRLVGHVFLHGGMIHLIGNMLFLWVFGNAICATLGNIKYLFIYLLMGICAGACQFLSSPTPSLGASGAINGVVGMCLFLFPLQETSCFWIGPFFFTQSFEIRCIYIILWWLLWDLVGLLFLTSVSHVAYAAHLGGFVSGFGLGWLLSHFKWVYLDKYDLTIIQMMQRRKPSWSRPASESEFDPAFGGYDRVMADAKIDNKVIKPTDHPQSSRSPRLRLKSPSSARRRSIFSPGMDSGLSGKALAAREAGNLGSIIDGTGRSRAEKGPTVFDPEAQTRGEAGSSIQTEPVSSGGIIYVTCVCGKIFKTSAKHAGKSGRCPKCKAIFKIPALDTSMIRFKCQCGKPIKVPSKFSGRHVRCPKCQQRVTIPKTKLM